MTSDTYPPRPAPLRLPARWVVLSVRIALGGAILYWGGWIAGTLYAWMCLSNWVIVRRERRWEAYATHCEELLYQAAEGIDSFCRALEQLRKRYQSPAPPHQGWAVKGPTRPC